MLMIVHASSSKSGRGGNNQNRNGRPNPTDNRNQGARGVVGGFLQRFRNRVSSITRRNTGARRPGQ